MKKFVLSLIMLMVCTAGVAQVSMAKVKNTPLHAGESRTFEITFKEGVKYARNALVQSGLVIESSERIDDDTYMIMSKAKASAWSWGEIVRVVVLKKEANVTVIRVYSKRRVNVNVTAKASYTQSVFSNIESTIEFGE
ncbi:MAG: hypothetical protein AAGI38_02215 [Bacteroidota bacterium]